jgi:hypothetical protein
MLSQYFFWWWKSFSRRKISKKIYFFQFFKKVNLFVSVFKKSASLSNFWWSSWLFDGFFSFRNHLE